MGWFFYSIHLSISSLFRIWLKTHFLLLFYSSFNYYLFRFWMKTHFLLDWTSRRSRGQAWWGLQECSKRWRHAADGGKEGHHSWCLHQKKEKENKRRREKNYVFAKWESHSRKGFLWFFLLFPWLYFSKSQTTAFFYIQIVYSSCTYCDMLFS